ncbi:hypothetical protein GMMP13_1010001 [Candidatus Magnetomoraceae bacterium gMMP-13]
MYKFCFEFHVLLASVNGNVSVCLRHILVNGKAKIILLMYIQLI